MNKKYTIGILMFFMVATCLSSLGQSDGGRIDPIRDLVQVDASKIECPGDHFFKVTGTLIDNLTWRVLNNDGSASNKATVNKINNSNNASFFWNANANAGDQIILSAEWPVGNNKRLTLTFNGVFVKIIPEGPITINLTETVTLSGGVYNPAYTYQWYRSTTEGGGWTPIPSQQNPTTYSTTVLGWYNLKVYPNTTCPHSLSNTVEIRGTMPPPIPSKSPVCVGDTIVMTCQSPTTAVPCTMRWYRNITETTPFHTGSSYIPTQPGLYYVESEWLGYKSARITIIAKPNGQIPKFISSAKRILLDESVSIDVVNRENDVKYLFLWGDGKRTSNLSGSASHNYQQAGTYRVKVSALVANGCSASDTVSVHVLTPLCASKVPGSTGSFKLDKVSGNIVFVQDNCPVQTLMTCANGPAITPQKVVKAEAFTFSDYWPNENYPNIDNAVLSNPDRFQKAERGKWRIKSVYAFNTSTIADDKNFRAGTFYLQNFNWSNEKANNKKKWLAGSTVTAYSPHGAAISERNILNIESAAKLGYHDALPYLTAQNAPIQNVIFESFENTYGVSETVLEDNLTLASGVIEDSRAQNSVLAHSGYQCLKLNAGGDYPTRELLLTQQLLQKGLLVKVWVRLVYPFHFNTLSTDLTVKLINENGQLSNSHAMKIVSRVGEWILCERLISDFGTIHYGQTFTPVLNYTTGRAIWFDDLRIQPGDAEMSCYVYDRNNLRLLTVFDDQHFGLYYQYNAEGKLIRKMIETERGIKTVQETHYNIKTQ